VNGKIKALIGTTKKAAYGDLFEKQEDHEIIHNFQINTNVNALKESYGRRYYQNINKTMSIFNLSVIIVLILKLEKHSITIY